jgi:inorganic triphosphatase YgiF
MAVRVRNEGENVFATLKWNGSAANGFHEREEINVPAATEHFISSPKELFSICEEGRVLLDLIGDEPLINLLEMRYLRSRCRLSYGGSIMELAIDTGSIITDKGEVPILELELELYAGDPKDIRDFGARLQEKFHLVPEDRSKLARGLALLRD